MSKKSEPIVIPVQNNDSKESDVGTRKVSGGLSMMEEEGKYFFGGNKDNDPTKKPKPKPGGHSASGTRKPSATK